MVKLLFLIILTTLLGGVVSQVTSGDNLTTSEEGAVNDTRYSPDPVVVQRSEPMAPSDWRQPTTFANSQSLLNQDSQFPSNPGEVKRDPSSLESFKGGGQQNRTLPSSQFSSPASEQVAFTKTLQPSATTVLQGWYTSTDGKGLVGSTKIANASTFIEPNSSLSQSVQPVSGSIQYSTTSNFSSTTLRPKTGSSNSTVTNADVRNSSFGLASSLVGLSKNLPTMSDPIPSEQQASPNPDLKPKPHSTSGNSDLATPSNLLSNSTVIDQSTITGQQLIQNKSTNDSAQQYSNQIADTTKIINDTLPTLDVTDEKQQPNFVDAARQLQNSSQYQPKIFLSGERPGNDLSSTGSTVSQRRTDNSNLLPLNNLEDSTQQPENESSSLGSTISKDRELVSSPNITLNRSSEIVPNISLAENKLEEQVGYIQGARDISFLPTTNVDGSSPAMGETIENPSQPLLRSSSPNMLHNSPFRVMSYRLSPNSIGTPRTMIPLSLSDHPQYLEPIHHQTFPNDPERNPPNKLLNNLNSGPNSLLSAPTIYPEGQNMESPPSYYLTINSDRTYPNIPGLHLLGESIAPGTVQLEGTIGLWPSFNPTLFRTKSMLIFPTDGSTQDTQDSVDKLNSNTARNPQMLIVPTTTTNEQSAIKMPDFSNNIDPNTQTTPDSMLERLYLFPISLRFLIPQGMKFEGRIRHPSPGSEQKLPLSFFRIFQNQPENQQDQSLGTAPLPILTFGMPKSHNDPKFQGSRKIGYSPIPFDPTAIPLITTYLYDGDPHYMNPHHVGPHNPPYPDITGNLPSRFPTGSGLPNIPKAASARESSLPPYYTDPKYSTTPGSHNGPKITMTEPLSGPHVPIAPPSSTNHDSPEYPPDSAIPDKTFSFGRPTPETRNLLERQNPKSSTKPYATAELTIPHDGKPNDGSPIYDSQGFPPNMQTPLSFSLPNPAISGSRSIPKSGSSIIPMDPTAASYITNYIVDPKYPMVQKRPIADPKTEGLGPLGSPSITNHLNPEYSPDSRTPDNNLQSMSIPPNFRKSPEGLIPGSIEPSFDATGMPYPTNYGGVEYLPDPRTSDKQSPPLSFSRPNLTTSGSRSMPKTGSLGMPLNVTSPSYISNYNVDPKYPSAITPNNFQPLPTARSSVKYPETSLTQPLYKRLGTPENFDISNDPNHKNPYNTSPYYGQPNFEYPEQYPNSGVPGSFQVHNPKMPGYPTIQESPITDPLSEPHDYIESPSTIHRGDPTHPSDSSKPINYYLGGSTPTGILPEKFVKGPTSIPFDVAGTPYPINVGDSRYPSDSGILDKVFPFGRPNPENHNFLATPMTAPQTKPSGTEEKSTMYNGRPTDGDPNYGSQKYGSPEYPIDFQTTHSFSLPNPTVSQSRNVPKSEPSVMPLDPTAPSDIRNYIVDPIYPILQKRPITDPKTEGLSPLGSPSITNHLNPEYSPDSRTPDSYLQSMSIPPNFRKSPEGLIPGSIDPSFDATGMPYPTHYGSLEYHPDPRTSNMQSPPHNSSPPNLTTSGSRSMPKTGSLGMPLNVTSPSYISNYNVDPKYPSAITPNNFQPLPTARSSVTYPETSLTQPLYKRLGTPENFDISNDPNHKNPYNTSPYYGQPNFEYPEQYPNSGVPGSFQVHNPKMPGYPTIQESPITDPLSEPHDYIGSPSTIHRGDPTHPSDSSKPINYYLGGSTPTGILPEKFVKGPTSIPFDVAGTPYPINVGDSRYPSDSGILDKVFPFGRPNPENHNFLATPMTAPQTKPSGTEEKSTMYNGRPTDGDPDYGSQKYGSPEYPIDFQTTHSFSLPNPTVSQSRNVPKSEPSVMPLDPTAPSDIRNYIVDPIYPILQKRPITDPKTEGLGPLGSPSITNHLNPEYSPDSRTPDNNLQSMSIPPNFRKSPEGLIPGSIEPSFDATGMPYPTNYGGVEYLPDPRTSDKQSPPLSFSRPNLTTSGSRSMPKTGSLGMPLNVTSPSYISNYNVDPKYPSAITPNNFQPLPTARSSVTYPETSLTQPLYKRLGTPENFDISNDPNHKNPYNTSPYYGQPNFEYPEQYPNSGVPGSFQVHNPKMPGYPTIQESPITDPLSEPHDYIGSPSIIHRGDPAYPSDSRKPINYYLRGATPTDNLPEKFIKGSTSMPFDVAGTPYPTNYVNPQYPTDSGIPDKLFPSGRPNPEYHKFLATPMTAPPTKPSGTEEKFAMYNGRPTDGHPNYGNQKYGSPEYLIDFRATHSLSLPNPTVSESLNVPKSGPSVMPLDPTAPSDITNNIVDPKYPILQKRPITDPKTEGLGPLGSPSITNHLNPEYSPDSRTPDNYLQSMSIPPNIRKTPEGLIPGSIDLFFDATGNPFPTNYGSVVYLPDPRTSDMQSLPHSFSPPNLTTSGSRSMPKTGSSGMPLNVTRPSYISNYNFDPKYPSAITPNNFQPLPTTRSSGTYPESSITQPSYKRLGTPDNFDSSNDPNHENPYNTSPYYGQPNFEYPEQYPNSGVPGSFQVHNPNVPGYPTIQKSPITDPLSEPHDYIGSPSTIHRGDPTYPSDSRKPINYYLGGATPNDNLPEKFIKGSTSMPFDVAGTPYPTNYVNPQYPTDSGIPDKLFPSGRPNPEYHNFLATPIIAPSTNPSGTEEKSTMYYGKPTDGNPNYGSQKYASPEYTIDFRTIHSFSLPNPTVSASRNMPKSGSSVLPLDPTAPSDITNYIVDQKYPILQKRPITDRKTEGLGPLGSPSITNHLNPEYSPDSRTPDNYLQSMSIPPNFRKTPEGLIPGSIDLFFDATGMPYPTNYGSVEYLPDPRTSDMQSPPHSFSPPNLTTSGSRSMPKAESSGRPLNVTSPSYISHYNVDPKYPSAMTPNNFQPLPTARSSVSYPETSLTQPLYKRLGTPENFDISNDPNHKNPYNTSPYYGQPNFEYPEQYPNSGVPGSFQVHNPKMPGYPTIQESPITDPLTEPHDYIGSPSTIHRGDPTHPSDSSKPINYYLGGSTPTGILPEKFVKGPTSIPFDVAGTPYPINVGDSRYPSDSGILDKVFPFGRPNPENHNFLATPMTAPQTKPSGTEEKSTMYNGRPTDGDPNYGSQKYGSPEYPIDFQTTHSLSLPNPTISGSRSIPKSGSSVMPLDPTAPSDITNYIVDPRYPIFQKRPITDPKTAGNGPLGSPSLTSNLNPEYSPDSRTPDTYHQSKSIPPNLRKSPEGLIPGSIDLPFDATGNPYPTNYGSVVYLPDSRMPGEVSPLSTVALGYITNSESPHSISLPNPTMSGSPHISLSFSLPNPSISSVPPNFPKTGSSTLPLNASRPSNITNYFVPKYPSDSKTPNNFQSSPREGSQTYPETIHSPYKSFGPSEIFDISNDPNHRNPYNWDPNYRQQYQEYPKHIPGNTPNSAGSDSFQMPYPNIPGSLNIQRRPITDSPTGPLSLIGPPGTKNHGDQEYPSDFRTPDNYHFGKSNPFGNFSEKSIEMPFDAIVSVPPNTSNRGILQHPSDSKRPNSFPATKFTDPGLHSFSERPEWLSNIPLISTQTPYTINDATARNPLDSKLPDQFPLNEPTSPTFHNFPNRPISESLRLPLHANVISYISDDGIDQKTEPSPHPVNHNYVNPKYESPKYDFDYVNPWYTTDSRVPDNYELEKPTNPNTHNFPEKPIIGSPTNTFNVPIRSDTSNNADPSNSTPNYDNSQNPYNSKDSRDFPSLGKSTIPVPLNSPRRQPMNPPNLPFSVSGTFGNENDYDNPEKSSSAEAPNSIPFHKQTFPGSIFLPERQIMGSINEQYDPSSLSNRDTPLNNRNSYSLISDPSHINPLLATHPINEIDGKWPNIQNNHKQYPLDYQLSIQSEKGSSLKDSPNQSHLSSPPINEPLIGPHMNQRANPASYHKTQLLSHQIPFDYSELPSPNSKVPLQELSFSGEPNEPHSSTNPSGKKYDIQPAIGVDVSIDQSDIPTPLGAGSTNPGYLVPYSTQPDARNLPSNIDSSVLTSNIPTLPNKTVVRITPNVISELNQVTPQDATDPPLNTFIAPSGQRAVNQLNKKTGEPTPYNGQYAPTSDPSHLGEPRPINKFVGPSNQQQFALVGFGPDSGETTVNSLKPIPLPSKDYIDHPRDTVKDDLSPIFDSKQPAQPSLLQIDSLMLHPTEPSVQTTNTSNPTLNISWKTTFGELMEASSPASLPKEGYQSRQRNDNPDYKHPVYTPQNQSSGGRSAPKLGLTDSSDPSFDLPGTQEQIHNYSPNNAEIHYNWARPSQKTTETIRSYVANTQLEQTTTEWAVLDQNNASATLDRKTSNVPDITTQYTLSIYPTRPSSQLDDSNDPSRLPYKPSIHDHGDSPDNAAISKYMKIPRDETTSPIPINQTDIQSGQTTDERALPEQGIAGPTIGSATTSAPYITIQSTSSGFLVRPSEQLADSSDPSSNLLPSERSTQDKVHDTVPDNAAIMHQRIRPHNDTTGPDPHYPANINPHQTTGQGSAPVRDIVSPTIGSETSNIFDITTQYSLLPNPLGPSHQLTTDSSDPTFHTPDTQEQMNGDPVNNAGNFYDRTRPNYVAIGSTRSYSANQLEPITTERLAPNQDVVGATVGRKTSSVPDITPQYSLLTYPTRPSDQLDDPNDPSHHPPYKPIIPAYSDSSSNSDYRKIPRVETTGPMPINQTDIQSGRTNGERALPVQGIAGPTIGSTTTRALFITKQSTPSGFPIRPSEQLADSSDPSFNLLPSERSTQDKVHDNVPDNAAVMYHRIRPLTDNTGPDPHYPDITTQYSLLPNPSGPSHQLTDTSGPSFHIPDTQEQIRGDPPNNAGNLSNWTRVTHMTTESTHPYPAYGQLEPTTAVWSAPDQENAGITIDSKTTRPSNQLINPRDSLHHLTFESTTQYNEQGTSPVSATNSYYRKTPHIETAGPILGTIPSNQTTGEQELLDHNYAGPITDSTPPSAPGSTKKNSLSGYPSRPSNQLADSSDAFRLPLKPLSQDQVYDNAPDNTAISYDTRPRHPTIESIPYYPAVNQPEHITSARSEPNHDNTGPSMRSATPDINKQHILSNYPTQPTKEITYSLVQPFQLPLDRITLEHAHGQPSGNPAILYSWSTPSDHIAGSIPRYITDIQPDRTTGQRTLPNQNRISPIIGRQTPIAPLITTQYILSNYPTRPSSQLTDSSDPSSHNPFEPSAQEQVDYDSPDDSAVPYIWNKPRYKTGHPIGEPSKQNHGDSPDNRAIPYSRETPSYYTTRFIHYYPAYIQSKHTSGERMAPYHDNAGPINGLKTPGASAIPQQFTITLYPTRPSSLLINSSDPSFQQLVETSTQKEALDGSPDNSDSSYPEKGPYYRTMGITSSIPENSQTIQTTGEQTLQDHASASPIIGRKTPSAPSISKYTFSDHPSPPSNQLTDPSVPSSHQPFEPRTQEEVDVSPNNPGISYTNRKPLYYTGRVIGNYPAIPQLDQTTGARLAPNEDSTSPFNDSEAHSEPDRTKRYRLPNYVTRLPTQNVDSFDPSSQLLVEPSTHEEVISDSPNNPDNSSSKTTPRYEAKGFIHYNTELTQPDQVSGTRLTPNQGNVSPTNDSKTPDGSDQTKPYTLPNYPPRPISQQVYSSDSPSLLPHEPSSREEDNGSRFPTGRSLGSHPANIQSKQTTGEQSLPNQDNTGPTVDSKKSSTPNVTDQLTLTKYPTHLNQLIDSSDPSFHLPLKSGSQEQEYGDSSKNPATLIKAKPRYQPTGSIPYYPGNYQSDLTSGERLIPDQDNAGPFIDSRTPSDPGIAKQYTVHGYLTRTSSQLPDSFDPSFHIPLENGVQELVNGDSPDNAAIFLKTRPRYHTTGSIPSYLENSQPDLTTGARSVPNSDNISPSTDGKTPDVTKNYLVSYSLTRPYQQPTDNSDPSFKQTFETGSVPQNAADSATVSFRTNPRYQAKGSIRYYPLNVLSEQITGGRVVPNQDNVGPTNDSNFSAPNTTKLNAFSNYSTQPSNQLLNTLGSSFRPPIEPDNQGKMYNSPEIAAVLFKTRPPYDTTGSVNYNPVNVQSVLTTGARSAPDQANLEPTIDGEAPSPIGITEHYIQPNYPNQPSNQLSNSPGPSFYLPSNPNYKEQIDDLSPKSAIWRTDEHFIPTGSIKYNLAETQEGGHSVPDPRYEGLANIIKPMSGTSDTSSDPGRMYGNTIIRSQTGEKLPQGFTTYEESASQRKPVSGEVYQYSSDSAPLDSRPVSTKYMFNSVNFKPIRIIRYGNFDPEKLVNGLTNDGQNTETHNDYPQTESLGPNGYRMVNSPAYRSSADFSVDLRDMNAAGTPVSRSSIVQGPNMGSYAEDSFADDGSVMNFQVRQQHLASGSRYVMTNPSSHLNSPQDSMAPIISAGSSKVPLPIQFISRPMTSHVRYSFVPVPYQQLSGGRNGQFMSSQTSGEMKSIPIIASSPRGMGMGVTRGRSSYTGTDGKTVTKTWYADETGFHFDEDQNSQQQPVTENS